MAEGYIIYKEKLKTKNCKQKPIIGQIRPPENDFDDHLSSNCFGLFVLLEFEGCI